MEIIKCTCCPEIFHNLLAFFTFKLQYTIEEKVIERAYKKLALDALVIQQGRLAEQKSRNFI